jgi:hypothetical protein
MSETAKDLSGQNSQPPLAPTSGIRAKHISVSPQEDRIKEGEASSPTIPPHGQIGNLQQLVQQEIANTIPCPSPEKAEKDVLRADLQGLFIDPEKIGTPIGLMLEEIRFAFISYCIQIKFMAAGNVTSPDTQEHLKRLTMLNIFSFLNQNCKTIASDTAMPSPTNTGYLFSITSKIRDLLEESDWSSDSLRNVMRQIENLVS